MDKQLVLYDCQDQLALITLNHPEKRNALSRAMLTSLKEKLDHIAADRDRKAVIIRAQGTAFSAGHDLRELVGGGRQQYASLFELCTQVMESIRTLAKPVIAQVQGIATAAGCQLVATCDLAVASEQATFATPGVQIGLFCTTPGVALSRALRPKKAMEMLLTGAPIDAREAQQAGLVNRVVPADQLEQETMKLAQQIISASGPVIALGKQAFYEQLALDSSDAYQMAEKVMVENCLSEDAQEGMSAFLEKRSPKWSG